ncbi:MAG: GGDEF domain-containing protein [Eubacterium sp.]|nr:GGDEF domain-containing protein [Eubacterium sp.]
MTTIIVTAEVVSAVFLMIVLLGSYLGRGASSSKRRTRYFRLMALFCMGALIIDAISYMMEGHKIPSGVVFTFTMIAFLMVDILIAMYARYVSTVITEKGHLYSKLGNVVCFLCIIDMVIVVITSFSGALFRIENHVMVYGPWQAYMALLPVICVVIIFAAILYNHKLIGKKSCHVLCSYIIFPMIALGIQSFIIALDFTYVGVAMSILLVYVFMQDSIITEIKTREEILAEVSATDTLTGLYNRRSYEKFLKAMDSELEVGVIFCDINGLKYANDNYGHEAGDQLICNFAELLKERFETKGIFRISGDEFVIFSLSTVKRKFDDDVQRLKADVQQYDEMAAVGWAYGSSEQIDDLIKASEKIMYKNKELYYKARHIQKRL